EGIRTMGVAVDRNKEVRIGLIGDLSAHEEVHETIVLSGIDYLDVLLFSEFLPDFQDYVQGNFLFQVAVPYVSGIMAPMAGIQDHYKSFGRRFPRLIFCKRDQRKDQKD